MDSLSRFLERNLRGIFLCIIAFSITLIQAELHFYSLLGDIWHSAAFAFGISAAILCIAATFVRKSAARSIAILLLLCSVWGLLGTANHLIADPQLCIDKSLFDALGDLSMAEQRRPAPLAPLGFTGLCLMGAIAAMAGSGKRHR